VSRPATAWHWLFWVGSLPFVALVILLLCVNLGVLACAHVVVLGCGRVIRWSVRAQRWYDRQIP